MSDSETESFEQVMEKVEGRRTAVQNVPKAEQNRAPAQEGLTLFVENRISPFVHQTPRGDRKRRKSEERREFEERRKKGADDLRYHYRSKYIRTNPLPWFPDQNIEMDDYYTDLIIKEISSFGKENRAKNEIDFRTIFKSSSGNDRLRILLEGNPGYGKTTLAKRIAVDWGKGANYLEHFHLLIFVACRELHGRNLEEYVRKKFTDAEENQSSTIDLQHWKDDSEHILFILDGLDECQRKDSETINKLIQDQTLYPRASVIATSRPLIPLQNTHIKTSQFYTKVEIKGFNRSKVEQQIDKFFDDKPRKGKRLKEWLFEGVEAYEDLTTCPLLCRLFCLLYEDDEKLPKKTTDVYLKLIKCLSDRQRSYQGQWFTPSKDIPSEQQEILKNFGKLCINALLEDKLYFNEDELKEVRRGQPSCNDLKCDVIMGFLVKATSKGRRKGVFDQDYYEPLHKTFLEFVAGFYLNCLVKEKKIDQMEKDLFKLQRIEYTSVQQVLLYTGELLGEEAYHILSRLGSITRLKDTTYLRLLETAGCHEKNVQSITEVMNLENISVNCSVKELKAWTSICTQSDVIKSLKFKWDLTMDSLSEGTVLEFFKNLKIGNKSIETVEVYILHGTMKEHRDPEYSKERDTFLKELDSLSNLLRFIMCKRNLRTLKIDLQVIQTDQVLQVDFSEPIVNTVVEVIRLRGQDLQLDSLSLNLDLDSHLLDKLLSNIRTYPKLTKLSMLRLCANIDGFISMADYIRQGNIKSLEVKLNKLRWISPTEIDTSPQTSHPELSGKDHGVNTFLKTFGGSADKELPRTPVRESRPYVERDKLYIGNVSTGETDDSGSSSEHLDAGGSNTSVSEKSQPQPDRGSGPNRTNSVRKKNWKQFMEESLSSSTCSQGERDFELFGTVEIGRDSNCVYHVKQRDHLIYPLPVCDNHDGARNGFHIIFDALKDPRCKLEEFYLNQCLILKQAEYYACLGEALSENISLKELRVDNMLPDESKPDVKYALPLLLALRHNSHLTSLDLSISKTQINSEMLIMVSNALSFNKTLSSLNISGWEFDLDLTNSEALLKSFRKFLLGTTIQKLNMYESDFNIRSGTAGNYSREEKDRARLYAKLKSIQLQNNSLKELDLAKVEILLDGSGFKPRDFLHLINFSKLSVLNISERSAQEDSYAADDISLCNFFEALRRNLSKLERLAMWNWLININNPEETKAKLKPLLSSLTKLTYVNLDSYKYDLPGYNDNIQERRRPSSECLLLKLLIKYIPNLNNLSLRKSNITEEEVPFLYKALKHRVTRNDIVLQTKFMDQEILSKVCKRLEESKSIKHEYNHEKGVLSLTPQQNREHTRIINRALNSVIRNNSRDRIEDSRR